MSAATPLQPAGNREAERLGRDGGSRRFLCDSQIDTRLSKHYLLSGRCWSITCHSEILLFPTSSPAWVCDGVSADHSPSRTAVRQRPGCVLEKPADVNQCMPLMTGRCTLLVCIYVFKLPSAVRIPNDRKRNKRISPSFASNYNEYVRASDM